MPEEIEEGHSPIDDLKGFDWGEIDDELNEFMGSDSENDSDTSTASDSSRTSKKSARGVKRPHDQANTGESDSDDDSSKLSKRVKKANARSTSLKTVKTPNSIQSESSLPTPGVTGDEDGDDEPVDQTAVGDEDDGFEDDLEADLMAEFDREDGGG
jgi:RNA polymerase II subunit A-like phosphatase